MPETNSRLPSRTSETYISSSINSAKGPDFPTGVTLIVGTLFLGYIPHLSVPPQFIITQSISVS